MDQSLPESVSLSQPVSHLSTRWCLQEVSFPLKHTGRKPPLPLWLSDFLDCRKHFPNLEHRFKIRQRCLRFWDVIISTTVLCCLSDARLWIPADVALVTRKICVYPNTNLTRGQVLLNNFTRGELLEGGYGASLSRRWSESGARIYSKAMAQYLANFKNLQQHTCWEISEPDFSLGECLCTCI